MLTRFESTCVEVGGTKGTYYRCRFDEAGVVHCISDVDSEAISLHTTWSQRRGMRCQ